MHDKITINCDGGSRGNPGKAAIGFVIRDEDKILFEFREKIGVTTNNVAEYNSLIKALENAIRFTKKEVIVIMDSELVVKQMNGEYQVRASQLVPLNLIAKKLENNFEKIIYKHVSRWDKFQQRADELVNEALNG